MEIPIWLMVMESVATVGIFLFAILVGIRERPATVSSLRKDMRTPERHQLIVVTKKGKVFSRSATGGGWEPMHSLPRKRGWRGCVLGEFEQG